MSGLEAEVARLRAGAQRSEGMAEFRARLRPPGALLVWHPGYYRFQGFLEFEPSSAEAADLAEFVRLGGTHPDPGVLVPAPEGPRHFVPLLDVDPTLPDRVHDVRIFGKAAATQAERQNIAMRLSSSGPMKERQRHKLERDLQDLTTKLAAHVRSQTSADVKRFNDMIGSQGEAVRARLLKWGDYDSSYLGLALSNGKLAFPQTTPGYGFNLTHLLAAVLALT